MSEVRSIEVSRMTSAEFGRLAKSGKLVVLQPVGSIEPHGRHLALSTDNVISEGAARRAVAALEERGFFAAIAPTIPYGVTECAAAFPGAVSVPGSALTPFLRAVAQGYLAQGAHHVCLINNHLEPAQDQAVRGAVKDLPNASVACPLTRRWARTLSPEFKSGACHAGQYETSIVLAVDATLVDEDVRSGLSEVPISLAEKLTAGVTDFKEMGLSDAYAGDPAAATAEEGEETLGKLAEMIIGEVLGAE